MTIYHKLFKLKNFLKKGRKLPLRSDVNMDKVYEIVSDEKFSEFLKFLRLTVEDKYYILTSMDLFDEEKRKEAIRIQYTMRGVILVEDIANALKEEARNNQKKRSLNNAIS